MFESGVQGEVRTQDRHLGVGGLGIGGNKGVDWARSGNQEGRPRRRRSKAEAKVTVLQSRGVAQDVANWVRNILIRGGRNNVTH